MRTTFTLDDDVAAAIERLRREDGLGLSEAVNQLARAGMAAPSRQRKYRHQSVAVGLKVDVSDIGAVLDVLDDER
ncbi:MAG: ribbon-helix-helix protein, CopG family [Egibacteraceae bacterium]